MHLLDYDAYFFDFDGLLADTERMHYKAYQLMLEKRGLILPWDFSTYCLHAHKKTEHFAASMYQLFPSLKKEQPDWMLLREEKQALYLNLIQTTKINLMPGVAKTLDLLTKHKKPLYVVTNATQEQIFQIKKHEPLLECIKTWVTRECYKEPKPSPECYLKALEIHGDIHCRGIGFEDAIRGLEALHASPLTPIFICPSNYPRPSAAELKSTLMFDSFNSLLKHYHL